MPELQSHSLSFHLRRKHKLLRALDALEAPLAPGSCRQPRTHLLLLLERASDKENNVSQLNYFLKHQFDCDLSAYSHCLVEVLSQLLQLRSGSIASFIAYRLCRKFPGLYWRIFQLSVARMGLIKWTKQQCVFYTDLYLYGFPFTLEDFTAKVFPHFRPHLLELLPRYQRQLQNSLNFPLKHQRVFRAHFLEWLEAERSRLVEKYTALRSASTDLQKATVGQKEDEKATLNYELALEHFEADIRRFGVASDSLELQFVADDFKLKSTFELKKQCLTFRTSFTPSAYEQSLYSGPGLVAVSPLRKHEMLKLSQSDAFINQIKLCTSVKECLNLSGQFLEQMNLQRNREYLIETIINDCYHYNNLSYILKIVHDIAGVEPSIREYCQAKSQKICAANRVNPKFQRLLCEMARFGLMDEGVLLDYCERILRNENSQTTKEISTILEQLGTVIYYRSLPTHTRINVLFARIESIIQSRVAIFSTEHLYHLRGLMSHLRNHSSSVATSGPHELSEIGIKDNFNFIRNKMAKLVGERQEGKVLEYLVWSVDHEEYLTSYFYACLLRELNRLPLEQEMHKHCLKTIRASLASDNSQKAVTWSRFLGELYNYECITRKEFLGDLTQLLQDHQESKTIAGGLKCVCSGLQTAKSCLKPTNPRVEQQVIFMLCQIKIPYLQFREDLEYSLNCEFQDILEYFNPHLISLLTTASEIALFTQLCSQSERHALMAGRYLQELAQGLHLEHLIMNETPDHSRRKYRVKEEEKCQVKWMEKASPAGLPAMEESRAVQEFRAVPEDQPSGKQSSNPLQHVPRMMKFTGRSKRDNKVKTISCTFEASRAGP